MPTVNDIESIINPQPKFEGKGIELPNNCFTRIPPINPPTLFPMKDIPRNVPRLFHFVTCFKKFDQIGIMSPMASE